MKFEKCLVGISMVILLASCVTTDYVGESYTPTTQVDVFYSMADVKVSHVVMGKITATAMDGWDSEEMVEELKTQAMAKGADALVIEGVRTETTGSYTSTTGAGDEDDWYITESGELKHRSSDNRSSTSITTETKEKVMEAELVKYR